MKKALFIKNSITALALEITVFILGFFVPKYIIQMYGSEIHGLSASILQIISVIQLIQAGAIGASIFALFKPIEDNDTYTVSKLYHASSRFYNHTSLIYLVISFLIAIISPFIIKIESISKNELIFSFSLFVLVGFIQFYYISKYDTLLSSHQKRYILTIGNMIEKIAYYSLLFLVLYLNLYFIFMYVSMLLGIVMKTIFLNKIVTKSFSHIIKSQPIKNDTTKIPNRNNVMITSILLNIVNALPFVLLSIVWGLEYVSIYSIYAMVSGIMIMLFNVIAYSSAEILGSQVIKLNKNDIYDMFDKYNFLYFLVACLIIVPSYFLITPFVNLYVGSSSVVNYSYPLLGYSIIANIIFYMFFLILRSIMHSFGLFKDQKNAIIIAFTISLPVFILTAIYKFDMMVISSITFYLIYILSIYIILYMNKFNYTRLLTKPLIYFIIPIMIMILGGKLFSNHFLKIVDMYEWIKYGFLIVFVMLFLTIVYTLMFDKNKIKYLLMLIFKNKIRIL